MKKEYNNGYWGKIEYWTSQLKKAVEANDLDRVDTARIKLDYFVEKHRSIYRKNKSILILRGVNYRNTLECE